MSIEERFLPLAFVLLLALLFLASALTVPVRANDNTALSVGFSEIASEISKNPKVLATVAVQFILGFALGYVSAKVVKYIVAFILVLIAGSILSVWSLGSSVKDFLANIMSQAHQLVPVVKNFLLALGVLTVAPVTLGLVLGLLAGIIRK